MIIKKLKNRNGEGITKVSSVIIDEKFNKSTEAFFSVNNEFSEFLVDEISDSFVLSAILPALVTQQDIKVEGAISDYFFYHSKTLIYLLGKVFGYNSIRIYPDEVININFNPVAVGTGFSGGVDSFATYLSHSGDDCLDEFKLTHLALFNVGSYGNVYSQTSKDFQDDVYRAAEFAKHVNKPLVVVDSNIGELYNHPDIYHYSLRSTICLSAGILSLQKLWKNYFISSSGTIDDMKLSKWDQYFYENSITQLLSNNNTNIFIAEADMDRVEKTKLLMNDELAQKYLYVCAADIFNAKSGGNFKKDTRPNCSECLKCARTEITLDYLGVLDKFKDRFDLNKYYKLKPRLEYEAYLGDDHFQREIFALMKEKHFKITMKMKLKKTLRRSKLMRKIAGKAYSILKIIGR